jgi:Domain of unknown function (DUF6458)
MTMGTSLFLIAVGAILKFAVSWSVAGIDLRVAGLVLMIVGVVGLLLAIFLLASNRPSRPGPRAPGP